MLLSILKVLGHSMEPAIQNSSIVVISSVPYLFKEPKVKDIIAFKKNKMIFVKRIKEIRNGSFLISGDNKEDSLEIGLIKKKDIVGKLLFKF